MLVLREKATYRMRFSRSQSPARKPQPPRPVVILSAADRLFLRGRSAGFASRMPLPGARFAPRGCWAPALPQASDFQEPVRLAPNSRRIRTYTNRESNTFKMSTSEMHDFNSRRMSTCEETFQGPRPARKSLPSAAKRLPTGCAFSRAPESSFCASTKFLGW
jgi:hypothetical protein